jgi:hypothetical protein
LKAALRFETEESLRTRRFQMDEAFVIRAEAGITQDLPGNLR